MNRREFLKSGTILGAVFAVTGFSIGSACSAQTRATGENKPPADSRTDDLPFEKVKKSDAEWKKILTPEQFRVTREAGTEKPYSSPLNDEKRKGTFVCVGCEFPLFSSEHKFDSETGWPSFYKPIKEINVAEKTDKSLGMVRTEVLCHRCDAHLGHVFDDGPEPTGLRYCINGVAMKFVKA